MEFEHMIRRIPERESFAAGSVIFTEGERAEKMYLVVEGQVRLSIGGESLAMESAGGLLGEMALIDQDQRSATATALTDCVLAPMDREAFTAMLGSTPEFALHVMSVLADRLRLANQILAAI